MRIGRFKIENYKSFRSSEEISLTSGFNVIVGKNNSGKTALVEALSLKFADKPHRSIDTVPQRDKHILNSSKVKLSFKLINGELNELLLRLSDSDRVRGKTTKFQVPAFRDGTQDYQLSNFRRMLQADCEIEYVFFENGYGGGQIIGLTTERKLGIQYHIDPQDGQIKVEGRDVRNFDIQLSLTKLLADRLRTNIYFFNAERMNLSEAAHGYGLILQSDARNLAQALSHLQGNGRLFDEFNKLVTKVFPQVKRVGTFPSKDNSNNVRIFVWDEIAYQKGRDDLAMPLSESGTGIGQVLAILYVVLTTDFPKTIIIDEPQSFLHPGAVRKLFSILKTFPQHQYIISTHSPTVIAATYPQNILLVRKEGAESVIEQIDLKEINKGRQVLLEVGARPSDVFGADDILWVEGATEEQCFPLILDRIAPSGKEKQPLLGTAVLGVINTGDFQSKHKDLIWKIYTRLSEGVGLMPPGLAFVFDKEGLSPVEQVDLSRESENSIQFIPRRMYENYLLHPNAIAHGITNLEIEPKLSIQPETVENWLDEHRWDRKYFEQIVEEEDRNIEIWLQHVHGANILKDIFTDLSEATVEYQKVEYGIALTEWIIDNAPDELQELADFLVNVLEDGRKRLHAETESEE